MEPSYSRSFSNPEGRYDGSGPSVHDKRTKFQSMKSLSMATIQAQVSLAQSLRNVFHEARDPTLREDEVDIHSENAWIQAVYNVVVFTIAGLLLAILVAVYCILEPFLHPLLWATLIGTFLFPFKQSSSTRIEAWLNDLDVAGIPLAVAALWSPLVLVNYLMTRCEQVMRSYGRQFLYLVAASGVLYAVYEFSVLLKVYQAVNILVTLSDKFDNLIQYMGLIQVIALVMGVAILLILLSSSYQSSYLVKVVAIATWMILITAILTRILGNVAQPFVLFLFIVGGVTSAIRGHVSRVFTAKECRRVSVIDILESLVDDRSDDDDDDENKDSEEEWLPLHVDTPPLDTPNMSSSTKRRLVRFKTKSLDEGTPSPPTSPSHKPWASMDAPYIEDTIVERHGVLKRSDSSKHHPRRHGNATNAVFIWLVLLILLLVLWRNPWLWVPLGAVAGWFMVKQYLAQLSWLQHGHAHVMKRWGLLNEWLKIHRESLFPPPIPTLLHWGVTADRKLLQLIKASVGSLMSAGIILGLLVLAMGGAILLVLQIQMEVSHTLQLGTYLLNSSIADNVWVNSVLSSNDSVQFEQFADTSYHYGRTWLGEQIQSLLSDSADKQTIVDEVLKLYDSLYQLYVFKNSTVVTSHSNIHSVTENTREHLLLTVKELVSDNIETIISLLKSMWVVLSANLSLLVTLVTSLSSVIFSGGTLVLNAAVFTTTLFYLLAYSDTEYLPIKWVTSILPAVVSGSHSNYGDTFSHVIQSVVIASIRRAMFYGLYTWFVLSLFSIDIIILPSVLAAIAGAVPFIGPYWVGLPGILQLWLVEDSATKALSLMLLFLLPPLTIDTLINREIEGGHPYLTGLAIAGGVYFSGLEGAIMGPVLLCCLLFLINLLTKNL